MTKKNWGIGIFCFLLLMSVILFPRGNNHKAESYFISDIVDTIYTDSYGIKLELEEKVMEVAVTSKGWNAEIVSDKIVSCKSNVFRPGNTLLTVKYLNGSVKRVFIGDNNSRLISMLESDTDKAWLFAKIVLGLTFCSMIGMFVYRFKTKSW